MSEPPGAAPPPGAGPPDAAARDDDAAPPAQGTDDGAAALEVLREASCDLLLTDLEMPNLDGLSLVAAVRELPAHRFLPVLVLSCRHPSEFDASRRHGVTGWMVKPIDSEHLRRWVRRVLPE